MTTRLRLTLVISLLIALGLFAIMKLNQTLFRSESETRFRTFVLGSIASHLHEEDVHVEATTNDGVRDYSQRSKFVSKISMVMDDMAWLLWLYPDEKIPTVLPKKLAPQLGDPRDLTHQVVDLKSGELRCGIGPIGPRGLVLCGTRINAKRLDGGPDMALFVKEPGLSGGLLSESAGVIRWVALSSWLFLTLLVFLSTVWFVSRPLRRIERALFRAAHYRSRQYLAESGGPDFESIAHSYNLMLDAQHETRDRIQYQVKALEQTLSKLSTTRDTLVRSEQLAQVGVMSAGMAHEVGNPLGIVAGYAEMAKEVGVTDAERNKYLTRIHSGIDRIQGILRNLLDFSRHEGDMGQKESDTLLVITQVLSLVRPQNRFDGIHLHRDITPGLALAEIPPGRLEQVVLNLVINAADAVGDGGNVTVRAFERGNYVVVQIQDDGPGVSESLAEKIFQPFVTTKPKGKGTGLGLFVCRHLVESYGGDLQLSSAAETGATFEIVLRASQRENTRPARAGNKVTG